MPVLRESYIEKAVKKWAREHDILPIKNTPMGEVGWPDDYFLYYYPLLAIVEFKAPGKKPRPIQAHRIAELQRRGYPVKVIDNVDDGIAFLDSTLLSRASSGAWHQSGVPWSPTLTRQREDNDRLRDNRHPQETKTEQEDDSGGPPAGVL